MGDTSSPGSSGKSSLHSSNSPTEVARATSSGLRRYGLHTDVTRLDGAIFRPYGSSRTTSTCLAFSVFLAILLPLSLLRDAFYVEPKGPLPMALHPRCACCFGNYGLATCNPLLVTPPVLCVVWTVPIYGPIISPASLNTDDRLAHVGSYGAGSILRSRAQESSHTGALHVYTILLPLHCGGRLYILVFTPVARPGGC